MVKHARNAITRLWLGIYEFTLRNLQPRTVFGRLTRFRQKASETQIPSDSKVIQRLESKLWGGFSEQATSDLEAVINNPESYPGHVSEAALALGRWQASHGQFTAARANAILSRRAHPNTSWKQKQQMLESYCLLRMGQRKLARKYLRESIAGAQLKPTLCALIANSYATPEGTLSEKDERRRLEWINRVYIKAKIAPLTRRDPTLPLGLGNLHAPNAETLIPANEQPKVSVIVPSYAASETVPFALDSLLRQTWNNLEIIVVDDRSPDNTLNIAREYAERDSRIIVLQTDENGGTYAARNLALQYATGSFITVHDADDWSHPQKIELQAHHLIENPDTPATITDWIRCYEHLYYSGPTNFTWNWILPNYSSLMFRSDVLSRLAGWDNVRVGGDSEFLRRLKKTHGDNITTILPRVPLSFALDRPESLTRQGPTNARTILHGVRRNYHDAAIFWLNSRDQADYALPASDPERLFPAPGFILSRRQTHVMDLIFIMDFNLSGGAFVSTINYIQAAIQQGLKVGVFQWRRYDLDVRSTIRDEILQMAQGGLIYIISPGEDVTATTVIAGYPVILNYKIDLPPLLRFENFFIITNQMSSRFYSGEDIQYDPLLVSDHVEKLFGKRPVWIPVSELVLGLMQSDGRYYPIHPTTWIPLINTSTWITRSLSWRGSDRKLPVIGRHSRDHYTKWPSSVATVRAAYCVDMPCEVRLLGGANTPIELLGNVPENWVIHSFGSIESKEFLEQLDFFVHYHHEDYIEEFGRAVIEAMAAGVPVILPDSFRPTFGEAAVYAEPEEVWPLINDLWSKEEAWLARAEAGRDFVREYADWHQFKVRLAGLEPVT